MISGRRSAPGRLGAYFQSLRTTPIGVGNYEPVSGTPDAPGAAEQTLLGVVQVTAPAGPYTVWGERSGNQPFVEQQARNRLLYVLNEQQITASEKLIGEPPAYLAVVAESPGDPNTVVNAFADSRYKWSKTEALYSQADPNRVPKMNFLHWAELRPMTDWKGRSASERSVAARLGGILVFPVAVPTSGADREAPQSSFAAAFKSQFPDGGIRPPRVVAAPESGAGVQLVSQQDAMKSTLLLLGLVGAGAVAIWAGYKITRTAQGAPA